MAVKLGSGNVSFRLGAATPSAVYLGSAEVWSAPKPYATLVSTLSTGDIFFFAQSDTGYIKVEWWDSTEGVYGTGVAGDFLYAGKAAGGAGEKILRFYPSDASGTLDGALNYLNCSGNSLTSLDVSGLTSLNYLDCSGNSLTSLDVSGLTSLTSLSCNNNSLTSLRAQNVGFSGGSYVHSYSAYNGVVARDNNLGSAALDQFYTDLAPGDSPLLVFNNPGTTGDDPTIATNKGYTVYGS